ncbi:MAG: hypothetical protein KDI69_07485 [Xanthomonadales bacterium]|nr:hypothetical protein [Xanthomonadales bacterium]
MNQPVSVFFTGMDSFDAEQLTALFNDANRRAGNHVSLSKDQGSATALVIDVDTLYGHMTWLGAQNSGQTLVALTSGATASADYVLHRPVTMEAMRAVVNELGKGHGAAPKASAVEAPAAQPTPSIEKPAPTAHPATAPSIRADEAAKASTNKPEIVVPSSAAASPAQVDVVPAAIAAPVPPAKPRERRLIDVLLAGDLAAGPHKLELPGLPVLALDLGQKVFLCGSGIKPFLPHTKPTLTADAWQPLSGAEFSALRKSMGGTQPLSRLIWLAALGGSESVLHDAEPDARYKLTKWPQIEREFPKHFRIATAMMKGYFTPEEFAQQSGATVEDVREFIAASLATAHAEVEPKAPSDDATPSPPRGLLGRLRGGR